MTTKRTQRNLLGSIGANYGIFVISLLPFIIICEIIFGVSSTTRKYAWIVCFVLIGIDLIHVIVVVLNGVLVLRDKIVNLKCVIIYF